jgi:hypothetical protein
VSTTAITGIGTTAEGIRTSGRPDLSNGFRRQSFDSIKARFSSGPFSR